MLRSAGCGCLRGGCIRSSSSRPPAWCKWVVQLATIQALTSYWTGDYDWRKCEARLNALPLIMTHAWPGSVIELLETVASLTDPTAHGGQAEDAFDLVLPSIPGYGFSAEPTELGWYAGRVAEAWPKLM